jgi:pilus assembly protein CpaF
MDKLIQIGSVPQSVADLLVGIVRARRNVLISGGTGSGKTTMLNAMSAFIDGRERIITIEDAAELQLQQVHVARLETRPANIEGRGEVPQRELVKNALRMRPDRIILGEVRGAEVLDMLQAMNTGHEGSMATIHANTARDAISRLMTMLGMTGTPLAEETMATMVSRAIHVIVRVSRMKDGRRRVCEIAEIDGRQGTEITLRPLFEFDTGAGQDGAPGRHVRRGPSRFQRELEAAE